ncbi:MAG: hypothetical protein KBA79_05220 [Candidatus Cloacimonetes bacterium]|nr:hypothetical protein [Candidatus Cloacimonadota bacterium]HOH78235.1 hypothetical protein [Candidatus Cloacimonadota bacterium]
MKAVTWIISAILAILAILFGIMWMNSANKISVAEKKARDTQKLYENATNTLNDVQTSLESMDQDLLGSIAGADEIPGTTPEERRARLINNISNMRSQIETNKKKIADMERQLSQVKGQRDGYLKTLNNLKALNAEKESMLAQLESQLAASEAAKDSAIQASQQEIAQREAQIREKQGIIENQNQDLNQVYYIADTRKNLIAAGVVDRKGGILGIGRVTTVSSKIVTEKFTPMNLLDSQQIALDPSPKGYAVLSNHVAASYTLMKEGESWILKVTDPESFRKQKFLVLEKK